MDYSIPCQYSTRLIDKLKSLDTKNLLDFDLIEKAISFAKKYHDGQFRKSGEPFYTHPLEVAYMISEYNLKTDVLVASILHDVVEDTEATTGMVLDHFSWRIAEMVDRLTRDRPDGTKLTVEEIINNAYQRQDKEVLLIKLFDRLHNVQTLKSMDINKQKKVISNTLQNFLSLSIYFEHYQFEEKLNQYLKEYLPLQNKNNQLGLSSFFSFFNNNFFSLQDVESGVNQA